MICVHIRASQEQTKSGRMKEPHAVQSLRAFIDVPSASMRVLLRLLLVRRLDAGNRRVVATSSRSTGANHSFKDTSCLQSARHECWKQ